MEPGGLTSGCVFPEIFSFPIGETTIDNGETVYRIQKSFGRAKMARASSITLPSIMGLGFLVPPVGGEKVRCHVCFLSSCFRMAEIVLTISLKAFEFWNVLIGCVTTYCWSWRHGQIWGFLSLKGDTINRSRWNLAWKSNLHHGHYFLVPNLVLIAQGSGYTAAPKVQNVVKIAVLRRLKWLSVRFQRAMNIFCRVISCRIVSYNLV